MTPTESEKQAALAWADGVGPLDAKWDTNKAHGKTLAAALRQAEASAKAWEADALMGVTNRDYWKDRAENAELHKLLSNHDRHWRKIADAIGTDGGYGGVDGKDGDRWGNAECVIRRVNAIKEVATEAASVVKRAGRRPDGTAWANLNINDLAAKVAALGAVESK